MFILSRDKARTVFPIRVVFKLSIGYSDLNRLNHMSVYTRLRLEPSFKELFELCSANTLLSSNWILC
jgi:hypothetical protein